MTNQQITVQRLAGWAEKCRQENATPFALVAICHGEHSGRLVLCIPEDGVNTADVAKILRGVANQIDSQDIEERA